MSMGSAIRNWGVATLVALALSTFLMVRGSFYQPPTTVESTVVEPEIASPPELTEDEIVSRTLQAIKAKYPAMFTHPDLREGEMWLRDEISEWVALEVAKLSTRGVTVRYSERFKKSWVIKGVPTDLPTQAIFVNALEYVRIVRPTVE